MKLLNIFVFTIFAFAAVASTESDIYARAYVETIRDFPNIRGGTSVIATVVMTVSNLFTRGTITGFGNDLNFVVSKLDRDMDAFESTAYRLNDN